MDISKKTLIVTLIVDLLLLAIGVVCLFVTKFSTLALSLFVAVCVMILISSILIWKYGKAYKK
ncbi:MAG: hypothetical protein IKD36_02170 [Clostridia bacterium]|nr:hypothetical protein [Clostridia bacterium]